MTETGSTPTPSVDATRREMPPLEDTLLPEPEGENGNGNGTSSSNWSAFSGLATLWDLFRGTVEGISLNGDEPPTTYEVSVDWDALFDELVETQFSELPSTDIEEGYDPNTNFIVFPDGSTLDLQIAGLSHTPELNFGRRTDEFYEISLRYGEDYELHMVNYFKGGRLGRMDRSSKIKLKEDLSEGENISILEFQFHGRDFSYSSALPGGPEGIKKAISLFIGRIKRENGISESESPDNQSDSISPITSQSPEELEKVLVPVIEILSDNKKLPDAAQLTTALVWAYEAAELRYSIDEGKLGRLDGHRVKSEVDLSRKLKSHTKELRLLLQEIDADQLSELTRESRTLVRSALRAFSRGDFEESRRYLQRIVDGYLLIDYPHLQVARTLFEIVELDRLYHETSSEEEGQRKSAIRILLAKKFQYFTSNRHIQRIQPIYADPDTNLYPVGEYYVPVMREIVSEILRNRSFIFRLDWYNLFQYHAFMSADLYPALNGEGQKSPDAVLARFWLIRFGYMYPYLEEEAPFTPDWNTLLPDLEELIGKDNTSNLESRTDLTALYLKAEAEISEEVYLDARDFLKRVKAHVEEGAPLTLFAEETESDPSEGNGSPTTDSSGGSITPTIVGSGRIEAKVQEWNPRFVSSRTLRGRDPVLSGRVSGTGLRAFQEDPLESRTPTDAPVEVTQTNTTETPLIVGAQVFAEIPKRSTLGEAEREVKNLNPLYHYLTGIIRTHSKEIAIKLETVAKQVEKAGQPGLAQTLRREGENLSAAKLVVFSAAAISDTPNYRMPDPLAVHLKEKLIPPPAPTPTSVFGVPPLIAPPALVPGIPSSPVPIVHPVGH